MNRAQRRAVSALQRPGMRRAWEPFERIPEHERPDLFAHYRGGIGDLVSVWKNNIYLVQVYHRAHGCDVALQLAVRRHDEGDGIGWDDLQRIKNEVVGDERIAIEVYPAQGDVIDQANMRHLFVLPVGMPAPFTIRGRWS